MNRVTTLWPSSCKAAYPCVNLSQYYCANLLEFIDVQNWLLSVSLNSLGYIQITVVSTEKTENFKQASKAKSGSEKEFIGWLETHVIWGNWKLNSLNLWSSSWGILLAGLAESKRRLGWQFWLLDCWTEEVLTNGLDHWYVKQWISIQFNEASDQLSPGMISSIVTHT